MPRVVATNKLSVGMEKWGRRILAGFSFLLLGGGSNLHAATTPLKESSVIDIVLKQNLIVRTDRIQPLIAGTEVTKAKSQFDTQISGQAFYNLDRSDKETIVLGTDNRLILYEARVDKKFPYGVEGGIRFSNIHNQTNSAFATDPKFFDTSIQFDAAAPFLKNRFGKSDRLTVDLSRAQQQTVEAETAFAIQDEVARALIQYWNWVASKEYSDLAHRFLKLAVDFKKNNETKKMLGLAELTDVLGTQALVEEREAEVLRAQNLLQDLEQRLLYTLNLSPEERLSTGEYLGVHAKSPDQAEGMKIALQRRPDFLALLNEAKAKDIQIAIAVDQKWPGLDLFTSLQLNSVDPSYGEALKQTFGAQHPDWLIGVRFNLALENRLAKSDLKKSELEKAQVLLRIKDLENAIAVEIGERIRELALQRQEYQKFSNAAEFQKRKLEEEISKFYHARSDGDTVIRFQGDYLDASKRALEAKVRLQIAWVELRRSMATLLPEGAGFSYDEETR